MKRFAGVLASLMIFAVSSGSATGEVPDSVKELFRQRCTDCHKGQNPPRGLNLESANVAAILDAPSKELPALKIIDTNSPGSSYLLKKVRRQKDIAGSGMPPRKALTEAELQVIEAWLAELK